MRRCTCAIFSLLSLVALCVLAATAYRCRNNPLHAARYRSEGKAIWSIGSDGFHRVRADPWPFGDLSKMDVDDRVADFTVDWDLDWIIACTYSDTYEIAGKDASPANAKIVTLETHTLCIPFIPWLGTLAVMTLCCPLNEVFSFVAARVSRRMSAPNAQPIS